MCSLRRDEDLLGCFLCCPTTPGHPKQHGLHLKTGLPEPKSSQPGARSSKPEKLRQEVEVRMLQCCSLTSLESRCPQALRGLQAAESEQAEGLLPGQTGQLLPSQNSMLIPKG